MARRNHGDMRRHGLIFVLAVTWQHMEMVWEKYSHPIFARGIDFLTLTLKMVPNFETSNLYKVGWDPTIVINGMNWGPQKMAENKRVFLGLFHPT